MRLIRNTEQVKVDENLKKYLRYGEEVKEIPNYPNYFATSYGRIFSGKRKIEYETVRGESYFAIIWKEMKPRIINGYFAINITNHEGIRKTEYVHYLIFITFNSIFFDKSVLKIVHRDNDKLNNHISNLAINFRRKSNYQEHKSYAYRKKMYENLIEEGL